MSRPDDERPPGMREVFQRGDGSYYVEGQPGAGPDHHDDIGVTPESVERKAAAAHGYEPAVPDSPAGLVPQTEPGAGHLLLVIARHGGTAGAFPATADGQRQAEARAESAMGWVVALPIVADRSR